MKRICEAGGVRCGEHWRPKAVVSGARAHWYAKTGASRRRSSPGHPAAEHWRPKAAASGTQSAIGTRAQPARRGGAILVFAMIALLVVSMIGASLMKSAIASLRQLQRQQMQIQASWLADAGCQRAVTRFRRDPTYTEETWTIPADQLKSGSAAVRITVAVDPNLETQRVISAAAEYPEGAADAIRVTRNITVSRPKQ